MKTKILTVDPSFPELDRIAECTKVIHQGGLVVFPTETVYGIAADYSNPKAIERLHKVKKRSADKPFSILVSRREAVDDFIVDSGCVAYKLIDEFWPGPLTLILPGKEEGKTIGIRMPNNIIALNLIDQSRCSIVAPSANFEGNKPPLSCQEALKDMQDLVEIAIDGGEVSFGQSSTLVDLTSGEPNILRRGPVLKDYIEEVAHRKDILFICTGNSCRSVMAEYLLAKMLGKRSDVNVFSAGTGVYVRIGASYETVEVLKKEGIDATSHRSQPITQTMLKKADLIFVMTQLHKRQVLEMCPSVEKRVYLLKEFVHKGEGVGVNLDIPDPIGKPKEVYEECIWTIKETIEKIIRLV